MWQAEIPARLATQVKVWQRKLVITNRSLNSPSGTSEMYCIVRVRLRYLKKVKFKALL
jgi:hypothetical protein